MKWILIFLFTFYYVHIRGQGTYPSMVQNDDSEMQINKEVLTASDSLQIKVHVSNNSSFNAREVVQIYISLTNDKPNTPVYELKDFKKVLIESGKEKAVNFKIPYHAFSYIDSTGNRQQFHGEVKLFAGNCSPGQRSKNLNANILEKSIFLK